MFCNFYLFLQCRYLGDTTLRVVSNFGDGDCGDYSQSIKISPPVLSLFPFGTLSAPYPPGSPSPPPPFLPLPIFFSHICCQYSVTVERAPYLQVCSYTALVVRERISRVKEGLRVSRGSHSNSELKRMFAVMVVRVLLVGSVFNPTSTAANLRSTHLTALIN